MGTTHFYSVAAYDSVLPAHMGESPAASDSGSTTILAPVSFNASDVYRDPVVTEVTPFETFYEAEDYHQNFYNRNQSYPYCTVIIDPKVQKLMKSYKEILA